MDNKDFKKKSGQACQMLKTLANQNRLSVLCKLAEGEKCVSDLLKDLDISQPALSQNLLLMKENGMLDSRQVGTQIFYFIKNEEVKKLLNVLYDIYCGDKK